MRKVYNLQTKDVAHIIIKHIYVGMYVRTYEWKTSQPHILVQYAFGIVAKAKRKASMAKREL